MIVAETDRLEVRHLTSKDTEFIFELLNEPSWLQFIGDKNIGDLKDAEHYIETGPIAMYRKFGFGLFLVSLKVERYPIGLCGLLQREALDLPDLGFAFLSQYQQKGFALEASSAVISYAQSSIGLSKILAIVSPGNISSLNLLEKLGFKVEKNTYSESENVQLLALNL